MAASRYWRMLTIECRRYLESHPNVIPSWFVGVVAAHGGLEHFAAEFHLDERFEDYNILLAFYWECHRLCDLGRGDIPYNPIIRLT
jgi:hypothetical protein